MNWKLKLLIIVGLCLTAGASFGQKFTRGQLQREYDNMSKLSQKRKVDELEKYFLNVSHPDFTLIDTRNSSVGFEVMIAQLKDQYNKIKAVNRMTNRIETIKLSGPVAIVKVRSDFVYTLYSTKVAVIKGYSYSNDTWIKGASGWKLKAVATKKEAATLNGKRIMM